ncbi:MAG: Rpn family recombination-promoting nuclease/putative transposase, partial [Verrucomicrobiales bacterium]
GEAKGEAKGIAEGEARGLALGQIQLFEELLGLEATPRETLAEKDLAALKVQLEELKKRFHRERS